MPFLSNTRLSHPLYRYIVYFICCYMLASRALYAQHVYIKISKLKETVDGEKLYSQGKYDDAIKAFKDAIDKGETRGEPQYYLGTILEQRHQYENSIPYFEDAIRHELQPEFREATVWKLILLHRKLQNYSEMLTYIDMLEDMGIKHPNLVKFRKEAENNMSPDKIQARALFKEGRKIISDWEKQHTEHDFWSENGGGESRKEVLNKYLEAIALDDSLSSLYWEIADHYEKLSEYQSAINVYEKIIRSRESSEAYYKIGVIYKRNGDFLSARGNFLNALKSLKNEKIKYYILINLSQVLYALGNYEDGIQYSNDAISEIVTDNNADRLMDQTLMCLHLSMAKDISALHKKCEFKISRIELMKKDVRIVSLYYFMEAEVSRCFAENSQKALPGFKTALQNYTRALIPPSLRNEMVKNIKVTEEPEDYNEDTWAALPAWCILQIQRALPFIQSSGAYRELYTTLLLYRKTLLENKLENQDNKDNYYSMLGMSAYELSMPEEAQSALRAVSIHNRTLQLEEYLINSILKQDNWEAAQNEILLYIKNNSQTESALKEILKKDAELKRFPQKLMNADLLKLLDIETEPPVQDEQKKENPDTPL